MNGMTKKGVSSEKTVSSEKKPTNEVKGNLVDCAHIRITNE